MLLQNTNNDKSARETFVQLNSFFCAQCVQRVTKVLCWTGDRLYFSSTLSVGVSHRRLAMQRFAEACRPFLFWPNWARSLLLTSIVQLEIHVLLTCTVKSLIRRVCLRRKQIFGPLSGAQNLPSLEFVFKYPHMYRHKCLRGKSKPLVRNFQRFCNLQNGRSVSWRMVVCAANCVLNVCVEHVLLFLRNEGVTARFGERPLSPKLKTVGWTN